VSGWLLVYEGFEPAQEGLREALCTLGNGLFATRGAAPWAVADGVCYPGTYLAGGYNRLVTRIAGRRVVNEDLVNFPNWLALSLRVSGEERWLDPRRADLLEYRQELDLRRGMLRRRVRFRDDRGRTTTVEEERLVSMHRPHLAALRVSVRPEDWSGTLEVRSALDGQVRNEGVERYRDLAGQHLEPLSAGEAATDLIWLKVQTSQSRLQVAQAARTRVLRGDGEVVAAPHITRSEPSRTHQLLQVEVGPEAPVVVEKTVALHSSRDRAISECGVAAREAAAGAGGFAELREAHALAWSHLWGRFDIEIDLDGATADDRALTILRLHIFHLLQTVSPHTTDIDGGAPARGLHGEAYRGHIFWDELFIFPLLNYRMPEITRALLSYRYRRLDAARAAAREEGLRGALYPWQSGSDGREESQRVHLNPRSGRWVPDNSRLQRHVNIAVAYNLWQYYQVTGDREFLAFYGAEMLIEIARMLASLCTHVEVDDRFEIRRVMGPDEFHDAYPDADRPGLDNNAYTNVMTAWVMRRALEVLELLPADRRRELREVLGLEDAELIRFDAISRRMRVVFHDDGIISQFQGYGELEELDWEGYRRRYGDIQRLDRILEDEGDTPNRYKLSKQADVLMLFFLLSSSEIERLFTRLGYPFQYDTIPRNIEYYTRRTSHGSTLSRVVHSWVEARSDREASWRLFLDALASDVDDVQGGTTPEGIHLGAMAGSVDIVLRCYTGLAAQGGVLWIHPGLPKEVRRLRQRLRFQGHELCLTFTDDRLRVTVSESGARGPVRIGLHGEITELRVGETRELAC
jgi:alpha,alpha-trehalase